MPNEKRVYVVDDDESVVQSVTAVLTQFGFSVKGFTSAQEFLDAAPLAQPGCLIADVQMPEINGVGLQRRLVDAESPLAIVVVTGAVDVATAVELMERGAVTLLEKPYDPTDLRRSVERALEASFQLHQRAAQRKALDQRLAALSEEERRVMELMLAVETNKSIARALDISPRTVDRRRQKVLEKMGVASVAQLAMLMGAAGPSSSSPGSEPQMAAW